MKDVRFALVFEKNGKKIVNLVSHKVYHPFTSLFVLSPKGNHFNINRFDSDED